jgi:hypothetical protein
MQNDAPSSVEQPKPRLRWFRYSLWSLFILAILVAIAYGCLAVAIGNQRKQKAAAEAIEMMGGTVQSEPEWLGRLLRDDSLVRVNSVRLFGESATDAGLVHLQGLRQLQWLLLSETKVTDAGLVHLQGLSRLKGLCLNNTNVTDAGLAHLQGLKRLQALGLFSTKVSNAGLTHLQGLRQLQVLVLDNTKVTDAGLVGACQLLHGHWWPGKRQ